MVRARQKADVALELFEILNLPYFCWHDADIRLEEGNFADNLMALHAMTDYIGEEMQASGVKLLWGTANLFTHRR
jgi:xylose isomerase